ncbi:MAG: Ig-like domain-containing protein, partial [Candidatus Limnocylindria bacterium]
MAKLPLAWASLLLVLASTSCGLTPAPSPSATPSVELTASPAPSATPDLMPPAISSEDPPPDGVLDASGVSVTFTEPVRGVDSAAFQLADAAGTVLPSTVALDPGGRSATLVPQVAPLFASSYTVTLSSLVHDLAGNALARTTWTLTTSNLVSFAAGRYTGYKFGGSTADLAAIKRATLGSSSTATGSEYRVMGGTGYLRIDAGIWQGYWIHGSPSGVAQDDLTAP